MMGESFQERFNRKYQERLERTRREFAQRNRLFEVYKDKVRQLYELLEKKVNGTPIETERVPLELERRLSIFESRKEPFEILVLRLQEHQIRFVPEGMNYQTGAMSLRIEHNNPREQPQTLWVHLRTIKRDETESGEVLAWMIKIGYRNYSQLTEEIIERLLESVFLS